MATSIVKSRPDYIVRRQSITDTGLHDYFNGSTDAVVIPGYTPIGVVGWAELSFGTVYFYVLRIDGTSINYAWRTVNDSSIRDHKFAVDVLYKKNG